MKWNQMKHLCNNWLNMISRYCQNIDMLFKIIEKQFIYYSFIIKLMILYIYSPSICPFIHHCLTNAPIINDIMATSRICNNWYPCLAFCWFWCLSSFDEASADDFFCRNSLFSFSLASYFASSSLSFSAA